MLGWFLGLSLIGRVAVAVASIATIGVVGSAISPSGSQQPATTSSASQKQEVQSDKIEKKTVKEEQVVPFQTVNQNDSNLESGKTVTSVQGQNGVLTITYEVTYTNGKETARKKVSEQVTKQPVAQVIRVGTYVKPKISSCDPNYSGGCVPNVSYDLDCPDIGFSVVVVGYDKHRFDRDGDGYGCESY